MTIALVVLIYAVFIVLLGMMIEISSKDRSKPWIR